MKQYFVAEPGKSPHGPYAEAMVKSAYEQGMYPSGTKVWWEGATQWELVELVFGKGMPDAVPQPPSAVAPDIVNKEPETGGDILLYYIGFMAVYICLLILSDDIIPSFRHLSGSVQYILLSSISCVVIGVIALICKGIRKLFK